MSRNVDQFCEELRIKLTNIESGIAVLKGKIEEETDTAEQQVRLHLDNVCRRMKQDQKKVLEAQAELRDWVEDQKTATADKIAEWTSKRDLAKLHNHADKAERYAAATIAVAFAALDEVEQAAMKAWLARRSANKALPRKS
jgi:hypothetical protein